MKHTAMKLTEINNLLEDFYEGKTTLEQEKELLDFFNSDQIPEELKDEQSIFLSCFQSEDISVPEGLKDKLELLIDIQALNESSSNNIIQDKPVMRVLSPETAPPKSGTSIIQSTWFRYASIAASIILIFTISFYSYKSTMTGELADTYTNPTDAYLETQRALTLVAQNLNTGFVQLEEAQENIGKANNILNQQFKKLNKNDN